MFDPTSENDFACFVDVLGYGAVLLGPGNPPVTEAERYEILLHIWEDLFGAIIDVRDRLDAPESADEEIGLNCFSDSLYLSCGNPQRLVFAAASLYYSVYLYYQHIPQNKSWMPWLRGAIGEGWLIDMRDPALKGKVADASHEFRNPVGPALARAYLLGERCGLKGFRLFIPEGIQRQVYTPPGIPLQDEELEAIRLRLCDRPWPEAVQKDGKVVYDVPWWRLNDSGMNISNILERHKWQASRFGNSPGGLAHYEATYRLISSNR